MKNPWTDQQLREALQAELTALHCIRPAVNYEEGNPEKAVPNTILAVPHHDHSSEQARQTNEHGFTSMRNDLIEG
jgi:hypothetical protein